MSATKQVKVDNWGIFFLQRLKHFFNRTDYCDLTLQFQDNAQLKVHRLVLNACTEYFELLERTCEMYEDCLIMPDDLQADVVVPIVNFMYTGQLEYKNDLLDKLHQTSQIMNMTVLTKLLDAQRGQDTGPPPTPQSTSNKRSYTKAFDANKQNSKKVYTPVRKSSMQNMATSASVNKPIARTGFPQVYTPPPPKIKKIADSRPTRYELPEELDTDNIFDESFTSLSYDSRPLMVHPESKTYRKQPFGIFSDSSGKYNKHATTSGLEVECKRIAKHDPIFGEPSHSFVDDNDGYETSSIDLHNNSRSFTKDRNQLFDHILENDVPKVTIETKASKDSSNNLDHAKIISEVLKKYPHLVKNNKNIKLKIVNSGNKSKVIRKRNTTNIQYSNEKEIMVSAEPERDFTYESDVMDSKEAARLIAMGAENVSGPWICLICGTPGRALHFTSYYKFRRHLIDIHNEKPIANMCEFCGLKSSKRNYLLHHLFTKHGVKPPASYNFPKCNQCNYVALTEGFLVKHKMSHSDTREHRCNFCFMSFTSHTLLLTHIQLTGHKICSNRKPNLQCMYCLKMFLRENNLYSHLKTCHKLEATNDGIIDNSEDEGNSHTEVKNVVPIHYEPYDTEDESNEEQYQIQQHADGNIHVLSSKQSKTVVTPKQKILNQTFNKQKDKIVRNLNSNLNNEFINEPEMVEVSRHETSHGDIIVKNEADYVIKGTLKTETNADEDYVLPDVESQISQSHKVTNEFTENIQSQQQVLGQQKLILKKSNNINQPIQIVVSNEEEYKALMASNPIIFDENNPGKTLAVLTNPHNAQLANATLNINNPQGNEMVIIQEEYPINVSEAITTDSNIVVVYSHPVDEQNKQFLMNAHYAPQQIITTDGIEAQFVQPSTVITPNYETITTSTPVISGQVIVSDQIEAWPKELQHQVVNQTMISDEQQYDLAVTEQTQVENTQSEISNIPTNVNNMVQLADLEMGPQYEEQTVESELPDISDTAVIIKSNEQNVSTEHSVIKQHIENEESTAEDSQLETEDSLQKTNDNSMEDEQTNCENNTKENDSLIEENKDTNENDEIALMETPQNGDAIEVMIAPAVNEQIQNLTSEWSDEENAVSLEDEAIKTHSSNTNQDHVIENVQIVENEEVEESIENIQQELNMHSNQNNDINPEEVKISQIEADNNIVALNDSNTSEPEQVQIEDSTVAPSNSVNHGQITSILNEWDENDPQENELQDTEEVQETEELHGTEEQEMCEPLDNGITHIEIDTSRPEVVKKESNLDGTENINNVEAVETISDVDNIEHVSNVDVIENVRISPKKEQNIRSLVSDWDEDEEDK